MLLATFTDSKLDQTFCPISTNETHNVLEESGDARDVSVNNVIRRSPTTT